MREDFESKTKEIFEQIEDLNMKMDDLDDDDGESSEDDIDSDQDLDSELGDTLDVNAITRDVQRDSEETPKQKAKSKGSASDEEELDIDSHGNLGAAQKQPNTATKTDAKNGLRPESIVIVKAYDEMSPDAKPEKKSLSPRRYKRERSVAD